MNKNLIIFFSFILFGLVIYSNSFSNNFVFSDHYLILDNYLLRNLKFIPYYFRGYLTQSVKGVFRPLTMASYNLNYFIHNYQMLGYRLLNIFIHCLNAFLIYLIITKLFLQGNVKASLLPALIYLSHPINSEAINYLMARSDLLLTLFILCSFYCFTLGLEARNKKMYIYSWFFYIFAFLSKENASLFVIILMIYSSLFLEKEIKKNFIRVLPFFIFTVAGLIYWRFFNLGIFALKLIPIKYAPPLLNFLSQLKILILYLKLFLIPKGFSFDHNYILVKSASEVTAWFCLFIIIVFLFLFILKTNNKIKFGVLWLLCFYFWKFFISLESPAMEHHFYLSLIGLIFILSFLFRKLQRLVYLSFMVPLYLSYLTYARNPVWRDEVTLSYDVLKRYPNSEIANYQIGLMYLEEGNYKQALEKFQKVLSLGSNPQLKVNSLLNISLIYYRLGHIAESIKLAKLVLTEFPFIRAPYISLMEIYLLNPHMKFGELLSEFPNNRLLVYFLGEYWYKRADFKKSEQYLKIALAAGVAIPNLYFLLGRIEEEKGNDFKAISYYRKLLSMEHFHKEAYFHLGTILAKDFNPQAEYFLKMAIRIDPYFASGYYNLGLFYLGLPDKRKASIYLGKAEKLSYPIPETVENLLKIH